MYLLSLVTAALQTRAKIWKQPMCLSKDERITKMDEGDKEQNGGSGEEKGVIVKRI